MSQIFFSSSDKTLNNVCRRCESFLSIQIPSLSLISPGVIFDVDETSTSGDNKTPVELRRKDDMKSFSITSTEGVVIELQIII